LLESFVGLEPHSLQCLGPAADIRELNGLVTDGLLDTCDLRLSPGIELKVFWKRDCVAKPDQPTVLSPQTKGMKRKPEPIKHARPFKKHRTLGGGVDAERLRLQNRIGTLSKRVTDAKKKRANSESKVKKLATPEEVERIKQLTVKWKTVCQEAIQALAKKKQGATAAEVISHFHLNPEQLGYDKETDLFT